PPISREEIVEPDNRALGLAKQTRHKHFPMLQEKSRGSPTCKAYIPFGSAATPSLLDVVRTGSVPAATVWSNTLRSFSLSNIISSRLRPVRSNIDVNSMAAHGQACSHMPQ